MWMSKGLANGELQQEMGERGGTVFPLGSLGLPVAGVKATPRQKPFPGRALALLPVKGRFIFLISSLSLVGTLVDRRHRNYWKNEVKIKIKT